MGYIPTPYIVLSILGGVFALTLAMVTWRHRWQNGAKAFTGFALASALWSFGKALELLSTDEISKNLWLQFQYLGVVFVPVTFIAFLFVYLGKPLSRRTILGLTVVPILTLFLIATNPYHHLMWRAPGVRVEGTFWLLTSRGPWFWVQASYSYLLLAVCVVLLLTSMVKLARPYQQQSGLLLLGVAAPIGFNLLSLFRIGRFAYIDLTSTAFVLMALCIGWGFLRFRLFDLVPVARSALVDSTGVGMIALDLQGRVVDMNPAARRFLNHQGVTPVGHPFQEVFANQPEIVEYLQREEGGQGEIDLEQAAELRHYELYVSPLCGSGGRRSGTLIALYDITRRKRMEQALQEVQVELEQRVLQRTAELREANERLQREIRERRRVQSQLLHDALHDGLTGLANRALFLDRLTHALHRLERKPEMYFAVFFLDFDSFKLVNDTFGHEAGDRLLIAIANRLRACSRSADTIARLGGDEFVMLVEELPNAETAIEVARRLQDELQSPFDLEGQEVFTSASIGIVVKDDAWGSPEEVLRDADIAMYRAKALGKAQCQVFDVEMRAAIQARVDLERDLHHALGRNEFHLFYQPIISVDGRRIAGFEALLRWHHPERGWVSPGDFIPLAEESGLMVPIGEWVLHQACFQLQSWQEAFPAARELTISVNVSSRQLVDSHFVQRVSSALDLAQLSGEVLKLEITESILVENVPSTRATLASLQALGIQIQMDDFGTGYSSLSYLHHFAIDSIKIDRSFVEAVDQSERGAEIVRTIVALANELNMDVVAEGVETAEQLKVLQQLHCTHAQGYFIARPLDAITATDWLSQNMHSNSSNSD